jgi:hypothetical protein
MKHQRPKDSLGNPYRQLVRATLFRQKFKELKATDFSGEPRVAIVASRR